MQATDKTITDAQSIETWNKAYEVNQSNNLWGVADTTLKTYLTTAMDLLNLSGHGTVLEIPCGDGRNTRNITDRASQVIAIDTSLNALTLAKKWSVDHQLLNVVFQQGDVYDTHFLDDSFDGVLCWDLLGHLQDPKTAISELLRLCKPGCRLVGSLFSTGDSTRGKDMVALTDHEEFVYADKFYFRFYSEQDARELLGNIEYGRLAALYTARWMDPPHEGYREYPHEHESWVFALEKIAK